MPPSSEEVGSKSRIVDDLDDKIRYDNENSGLDFKKIQYKKEMHQDLIKDVMCMANADIDGNRYIIIGVDHKSSNERDFIGIKKEEFVDNATYQQLIKENIEPEISIDYFAHEIDGVCLGIFKISQCYNKPYMMKKKYKELEIGHCWIRKGSHQFRMTREDHDRIIAKRTSCNEFNGKIKIYFSNYAQYQEITLPTAKDIQLIQLPSERAANKIRDILKRKKSSPNLIHYPALPPLFGHSVPYEDRSIEELEKNLIDVKETYEDDDCYEFFELRSHKLNITISNEGDAYIEDASLQIDINKIEGLFIPEKVFKKPERSSFPYINANLGFDGYPEVKDMGDFIRIHKSNRLGLLVKWDIKHQLPEEAFGEPVRFLFSKNLEGKVIQLKCKLYGKNLKEPFETTLKIKVVPNDTSS